LSIATAAIAGIFTVVASSSLSQANAALTNLESDLDLAEAHVARIALCPAIPLVLCQPNEFRCEQELDRNNCHQKAICSSNECPRAGAGAGPPPPPPPPPPGLYIF